MDTGSYIQSLLVSDSLRKSVLREMARALQLPKGSRGLDAGLLCIIHLYDVLG
jgi:hypothetical protein